MRHASMNRLRKAFALLLLVTGLAAGAVRAEQEELPFTFVPDGDGGLIVTGYEGRDHWVELPGDVAGVPVTGVIVDGSFSEVAELTLPAGARILRVAPGSESQTCMMIKPVENHPSLMKEKGLLYSLDGKSLLWADRDIQEAEVRKGTLQIARGAFGGCASLTRVELPDGLRFIHDQAFAGCTSLEKIILPDSVEYCTGGTFSGCTALRKVRLSAGLEKLTPGMFESCRSLQEVICPGGKTVADSYAFAGNTGFTLVLPENSSVRKMAEKAGIEVQLLVPEAAPVQQDRTDTQTSSVLAELNSLTAPQAAEPGQVRIYQRGAVNIRKNPSADSPRIGNAPPGGVYPILEVAGNGWYKIRFDGDKEGYVSPKVATRIY